MPTDPNALTRAQAKRQYTAVDNGRIDRLHVFGHSYAEGFATTGYPWAPFSRYSSLLARRLGAREVNHAVSGGQALIGQRHLIGRVNTRVNPGSAPATVGPIKLAIVDIGANDIGDENHYTYPSLFPALVTLALRRIRAGRIWESSDAAFFTAEQNGGGANWTVATSGNYRSGSSSTSAGFSHMLGAVGNRFTFTLPATFPGGTVHIVGFHLGAGAAFDMTVDGGAAPAWDTTVNSSGTVIYPDTYTISGLAAGAHSIVGTATVHNASGSYIDYMMQESPTPPGVLLMEQMNAPTPPSGAGTHTPITTADRALFNGYLQDAADSFADGMVRFVPRTLDIADAALWGDAGHPSDLGHEIIEEDFLWPALKATGWLNSTKLPRPKGPGESAFTRLHIAGHFDDSAAARVTLVDGTATLSSRAITAFTRAALTRVGSNANAGHLYYTVGTPTTTSNPGTMTIASSNAADTSVVDVLLYDVLNAS